MWGHRRTRIRDTYEQKKGKKPGKVRTKLLLTFHKEKSYFWEHLFLFFSADISRLSIEHLSLNFARYCHDFPDFILSSCAIAHSLFSFRCFLLPRERNICSRFRFVYLFSCSFMYTCLPASKFILISTWLRFIIALPIDHSKDVNIHVINWGILWTKTIIEHFPLLMVSRSTIDEW